MMDEDTEVRVIHWGEIADDKSKKKDVISDDTLAKYTNWNELSPDVPPLYQPNNTGKMSRKELSKKASTWMKPPLDSKEQSYMLHHIELQHFKRRMRYMLSAAHSQQTDSQKGSNFDSSVLPSPPPLPKRFCASDGRLVSSIQPTFLSGEYSLESSMKGLQSRSVHCPVQLDNLPARQLLLKSVAAVAAHAGFENASETTLNTLTDIAAAHCFKLCKLLKSETQQKAPNTSAIDIFAQVYLKSHSEHIMSLQKFWLTRVKAGALKLEKEVFELLEEYNLLKESNTQVEVKEEKP